MPGFLFMNKIHELLPVISSVSKRLGRKYQIVPIPIKSRRQHVLALDAVVKYTKNFDHRTLSGRMTAVLSEIFGPKKNQIVKKAAEQIKTITDSRMYLTLR